MNTMLTAKGLVLDISILRGTMVIDNACTIAIHKHPNSEDYHA